MPSDPCLRGEPLVSLLSCDTFPANAVGVLQN
jgi:hypothetical protein